MIELPWKRWAELAGFTLAYMAVARLSLLTLGEGGIAVVWPTAGLSLGVLLLRGRWLWPGVVVGASAANLLGDFPLPLAVALGLANGLETLVATTLLRDVVRLDPAFSRVRDIVGLGLVSMGAALVGASTAGLSFLLTDSGETSFWQVSRNWWVADQVSFWIGTPAVLTVARSGLVRRSWRERLLFLLSCLALAALSWVIFWRPYEFELVSRPFIVFPLLVWIALRFGPFGSALGSLLLAVLAIGGTLSGTGPFWRDQLGSQLDLQAFLGAAPFTSMVLAVVTEDRRRNAERALHNERWLQAMLHTTRAAIWEWDARSNHLTVSATYHLLFGAPVPPGAWRWEDFLSHVHPEDRPRVAEELDEARCEQALREPEFRVRWRDGSIHWLTSRATPRLEAGQCVGLVGVTLDITQRKRQEQALAESEQRFRLMADTAPVLLWMSDPEGGCTYLNRPWLDFTGRPLEQQLGEGWVEAVHPEDVARRRELFTASREAPRPFELEYRLRRHDGEPHWILEHAVPRFAGETFLGYLGACVDIQRLKEAEALLRQRSRRLAELNQELARSNADLEQFAHVTSHDLREPIRMVLSYGELLERRQGDRLDEKGRKYLGYIMEGALRLQELVSDLLAYSRAGRSDQRPVPVALDQVLGRVQLTLHRALVESQARLTVGPLPTIQAFPSQMEVLFQNLLENALKFRRAVPPEITVLAQELPTGWELQVRDNGIGIEPQYLERIFGLFQRLHSREQYPGTGMGLAICKRIVERHGGSIRATSRPGEGTTFHIVLPRQLNSLEPKERAHDAHRGAARGGQPGRRGPDAGGAVGEQAAGEPGARG